VRAVIALDPFHYSVVCRLSVAHTHTGAFGNNNNQSNNRQQQPNQARLNAFGGGAFGAAQQPFGGGGGAAAAAAAKKPGLGVADDPAVPMWLLTSHGPPGCVGLSLLTLTRTPQPCCS
jgi:hypothetical protein